MTPIVLSELRSTNLNRQLKRCFAKSKIKLLTKNNGENADFRIVSINRNATPQEIQKKLAYKKKVKTIVFSNGDMNGKQLDGLFSGHTLSLHNRRDPRAIQECVDRVLDELFLDEYLKDIQDTPPPSFELLANTAICIIDRSYRNVYVNERHKNNTPGPNMMYGLCWQQHRNLFDRAKPCNGCPAKRLFDKNMIPDPQYRVRKKTGRQDVTCSRLQVLPINDGDRDRIVASLEISLDVDPINYRDNKVEQEKMLESCLESVLDEGFTRSRVFIYIEATKSLRGYKEKYIDPAGKITADFTKVILPFDQFDKTVFEMRESVTRTHKRGEIMEALYEDIFKKDLAYCWGEFPLFEDHCILGKLIVDKFHRRKVHYQSVTRKEMKIIKPYALFIQQLLENMSRTKTVELANALLEWQKKVIDNILALSSASSAIETMLEWIPKYMKGIVCSNYLRVLNDKGDRLVLDPLFSASNVKPETVRPIGLKDPKKISSVAYKAQMPLARSLSKEERERLTTHNSTEDNITAKCSIPLTIRGMKYVLCLQGTDGLLNPNVIECLNGIARAATIYASPIADVIGKSVLVLGPDASKKTSERLKDICAILNSKNYETVLVKNMPTYRHISILDKTRHFANQSRFVIVEDSIPSGHIAEISMCAANRIVTAVLRRKGCKPNNLLAHCSLDYNFMQEFIYESDPSSDISLEKIVNKAVEWAEKVIDQRKDYFGRLFKWF